MKNWSDIKSREERGESRPLTNTNISSKERRSEIIQNILSLFVNPLWLELWRVIDDSKKRRIVLCQIQEYLCKGPSPILFI